jgi:hypothetical protein
LTGENVTGAVIDYAVDNYQRGAYVADSSYLESISNFEARALLLIGIEIASLHYLNTLQIADAKKTFIQEYGLDNNFFRDQIVSIIKELNIKGL